MKDKWDNDFFIMYFFKVHGFPYFFLHWDEKSFQKHQKLNKCHCGCNLCWYLGNKMGSWDSCKTFVSMGQLINYVVMEQSAIQVTMVWWFSTWLLKPYCLELKSASFTLRATGLRQVNQQLCLAFLIFKMRTITRSTSLDYYKLS